MSIEEFKDRIAETISDTSPARVAGSDQYYDEIVRKFMLSLGYKVSKPKYGGPTGNFTKFDGVQTSTIRPEHAKELYERFVAVLDTIESGGGGVATVWEAIEFERARLRGGDDRA